MINILKRGRAKKERNLCEICGTKFTYQLDDITYRKSESGNFVFGEVMCPVCNYKIHVSMYDTKAVDECKEVKIV